MVLRIMGNGKLGYTKARIMGLRKWGIVNWGIMVLRIMENCKLEYIGASYNGEL